MNVFEVNFVASPLSGLIGGASAAKAGSSTLAASLEGLLVGAVLWAVLLGLAALSDLDERPNATAFHKAASRVGLVAFVLMLFLPVISWPAAYCLVRAIS